MTANREKSILLYCNWGVLLRSDGSLAIPSVHKRYLKALHNLGYAHITLLTKATDQPRDGFDASLDVPGLEIVPLPWFDSYAGSVRVVRTIFSILLKVSRTRYDKVYIRVFEPFTWFLVMLFASRDGAFTRDNVVMHFISEPKSAIFGNLRDSSLKKWIRFLLFIPEYFLTLAATRLCRPTANGPVPVEALPSFFSHRFIEVVESALTEDDVALAFGEAARPAERAPQNVLLYVGYLRYSKGIDVLLEAVRLLVAEGETRFVLKIVGEGEYRPQAETFIAENELENQIELLGYVPFSSHLFDIYRKADIFINPSLSETGPRVLLEAKVFGNYLISTEVGYVNTIIENSGQGLIVQKDDPRAIANAIEQALETVRRGDWVPPETPADFKHSVTTEEFFRLVLNET